MSNIRTRWLSKSAPFFSIEFFPPKTEQGFVRLLERAERLSQLGAAWIDVTWSAFGGSSERSLELCIALCKQGYDVLMHLTCANLSLEEINTILDQAYAAGVRNVLALRGDPLAEAADVPKNAPFPYAKDLVRHIKARFKDNVAIGVAGYPDGHPDTLDLELNLNHLKEKCDAGADFILTQLSYDSTSILQFAGSCREKGIQLPIVVGLMPIYTYERLVRIVRMSQISAPADLFAKIASIKLNDDAIKAFGVEYLANMSREILAHHTELGISGLHFYTLNLEESVTRITKAVGLSAGNNSKESNYLTQMQLPLERLNWDEHPNGRFLDPRSPAHGELLGDYYFKSGHKQDLSPEFIKKLSTVDGIKSLFIDYIEGNISSLPWNPDPVASETSPIIPKLKRMCQLGYLTTNSQPSVNGCVSTDPVYGWGPANGRVYQKAYVEFFVSPEDWEKLQDHLNRPEWHDRISYIATCGKDQQTLSKPESLSEALTWGIYPGREVIVPTRVDVEGHRGWAAEAFGLLCFHWVSRTVKSPLTTSWWLVILVDEDFTQGDGIWKLVEEVSIV